MKFVAEEAARNGVSRGRKKLAAAILGCALSAAFIAAGGCALNSVTAGAEGAQFSAEHGTLVSDRATWAAGDTIVLKTTPDTGYELASLVVNGKDVTDSVAYGNYVLKNAEANVTAKATFRKAETFYLEAGAEASLYNSRKGTVYAEMDCVNVFTVADMSAVTAMQKVGVTTNNIGKTVSSGDYLAIDLQNNDNAAWRTFYVEVNGIPSSSGVDYYMVDRLGEVTKKTTNDGNRGVITERYNRFSNATWNDATKLEGFYGTAILPLANFEGVTEIQTVSVYSTSKDKSYARFNVGAMRVLDEFSEQYAPVLTEEQIVWKPAEDNFTSYVEQGQENKTDLYAELRFLHAGDYRIGCRTDKVSDYDSHYVTFPQNMIGEDGYVDLEGLGIKGMVMDVKNLNLTQTGFAIRIAGDTHSSLGDTKDHLLWQTSIASGFQSKLLYENGLVRTRVPGFLPYDESGNFTGSVFIPFSSAAFTNIGAAGNYPTKIQPAFRIYFNNLDKSGIAADEQYQVNISNIRFVTDDSPYEGKLITVTGMGGVIAGNIGGKEIGGSVSVLSGTEVSFRVTPNSGYRLEYVTCSSGEDSENVEVGADGTFHITVTNDVTIVYFCDEISYTITYDLGGGTNSELNPESYYASSGKITLFDPEKEGDEFLGWKDANDRWIYEIDPSLMQDVTLKAVWKSSENASAGQNGSNTGLIVGLSVAGGAVVIGAAAAVTVILLKKRKENGGDKN